MKAIEIGAALFFLLTFAAGEVQAQTPVREAAERLSAALSGERATREALLRDHFTPRLRDDPGEAAWLATLDSVAAASGGVDIVAAEPSETDRFGEFTVRAREGGRYARLVLGVARTEPQRISTLFLLPARDPAALAANAWPQTRVAPRMLAAEIRRRVDALVAEDVFSGAVLVARNGRIVHEQYAGVADRSTGALNQRRTTFNLASMGKMFTAVAIGQLVEQGRVSLDDRVERWAPDYPEVAGRRITVAQLLAHTAGLDDVLGPDYRASPAAYLTADAYLPLIAKPPLFEPGARFHYSNAGYSLLGVIIERASGESYHDYIERHVFAPARMRDAGFPRLDQPEARRAVGYFRSADDAFGHRERQSNENAIALQGNAAGGAYATARDMLAFAGVLTANDLVSAETAAMLQTPRNDFMGTPTPTRYGYGFAVHACNGRTFVGHNGGGAQSGVHSTLLMSADGEWSVVVLSNYDAGPEDLAMSLCRFLALQ